MKKGDEGISGDVAGVGARAVTEAGVWAEAGGGTEVGEVTEAGEWAKAGDEAGDVSSL